LAIQTTPSTATTCKISAKTHIRVKSYDPWK
jgi:hypothetical protein